MNEERIDQIVGELRNLQAIRTEIEYGKGASRSERKQLSRKIEIIIKNISNHLQMEKLIN